MHYLIFLLLLFVSCPAERSESPSLKNEEDERDTDNAVPQSKQKVFPLLFNYAKDKKKILMEDGTIFVETALEKAIVVSLNPKHQTYQKIYRTGNANNNGLAEEKYEFIPFWNVLILKEEIREKLENGGLKDLRIRDVRSITNSQKIVISPSQDNSKGPFQKVFAFAPGTFSLATKGEGIFINLSVYKRSDTQKVKDRDEVLEGKAPIDNFLVQIKEAKD